jgi:hypothetical protein
LPYLLQGLKLPPEPSQQEEEDRARVAAAEAAIQAIEHAQHDMGEGHGDSDFYADAGARIMELYRQRIDGRSKTGEGRWRGEWTRSNASSVSRGLGPNEPNSIASAGPASSRTRQPANSSGKLICWRRASEQDDEATRNNEGSTSAEAGQLKFQIRGWGRGVRSTSAGHRSRVPVPESARRTAAARCRLARQHRVKLSSWASARK